MDEALQTLGGPDSSDPAFGPSREAVDIATGNIVRAVGAGIVTGWILALGLGLVGALLGTRLAQEMGVDVWWRVLTLQALVAAMGLVVIGGLTRVLMKQPGSPSRRH